MELSLAEAGAGRALLERGWQDKEITSEKARQRAWSEPKELTLPETRSLSCFGPAGEHRWHRLAVLLQRLEVFSFHQSHPGCVQYPQSCDHDRCMRGCVQTAQRLQQCLRRKVSETVLIVHLYSASFGGASAEMKVVFVAEIGGWHSTSLNLLSQSSGLFCLCTTSERREIKVMFKHDCCCASDWIFISSQLSA